MNISHSPGAMRQRRADWLRNASHNATAPATQRRELAFVTLAVWAALAIALCIMLG